MMPMHGVYIPVYYTPTPYVPMHPQHLSVPGMTPPLLTMHNPVNTTYGMPPILSEPAHIMHTDIQDPEVDSPDTDLTDN